MRNSGKHFYATLEGLRGLSAVLVFARHASPYMTNLLFHSYLAVDLFFVLSGFVLAASYDRELASRSLSVGAFMKMRLIRLYPLFLLAIFVAFAAGLLTVTYWGARLTHMASWLPGAPLTVIVSASLFSFLMLPSFFSRDLYPLNGSAWSLFYELIVNVIYGLVRPRCSLRGIGLGVAVCGCGVIVCAVFYHGVDVGFLWRDIPEGLVRAGYSFGAGLLVFHLRQHSAPRLKEISCNLASAGILVAAGILLVMPSYGFDAVYDIAATLFLFPVVVFAASLIEPTSSCRKLFALAGTASYGLYILHVPVSNLIAILYEESAGQKIDKGASAILLPCLAVGVILLDRYYDIPMRRILARKCKPA